MVDGVNNAGANRSVNNADAVPAHRPDFRGMTVRQIYLYGSKTENYGDARAAAEYLGDLARKGDAKANRALLAALRGAKSDPKNEFAKAAKINFKEISSNAQKQSTNMASFHQVARPTETRQDRYNALTGLLKSEYRSKISSVPVGMDLRTGEAEIGEGTGLTIVQFHKYLEKKGVAHIAITWFTELEKCDLDTSERIKIQTGLVSVLEGLNCNSIHALEEFRKSRTSNTSKEVFDFLTGDIWRENKAAMWLRELNTLFPKESLKELS
ncbi:hypothetical protein IWQ51_006865, partial [Labrenzia sp. EL_142]|nr:hypothetical protein [Labrenzia sp. EL_142]